VKQPVTECIGKAGVGDVVAPLAGRELAGDDRRAGAGAVLDNLEQIAAAVFRERAQGEIVEAEDLDAGEAGEEADVAPVGVGQGEFLVEPGDAAASFDVSAFTPPFSVQ